MDKKVERDLKLINEYEKQIGYFESKIREIKAFCKHREHYTEYVSTTQYDCHPKRVCKVCGRWMGDPTLKEKADLLNQHYNELGLEPEDAEAFKSRLDGFNLPRFNFRIK